MHRLDPRTFAPPASPRIQPAGTRPLAPAPAAQLAKIFPRDRLEFSRRDAGRPSVADRTQRIHPAAKHPDEVYVTGLYRALLGRKPDAEGLAFYLDKLANGATREAVRAEITASPEYRKRQAEPAKGEAPPTGDPGAIRHISQRTPHDDDGSYTNANANCGPASAAMILRAFGYRQDLMDADLINHLGGLMGTGGDGTGAWNLYNAVENLPGYHAAIQEGSNPDWIIQQLEAGRYVVANGNYYGGVNADPNGLYGQGIGDHYVTVAGWDGRNFLVHDPWNPGGEPEKYSYGQMQSFLKSNHHHDGYAVAIGRDGGTTSKAPAGDTAVLIGAMSEAEIEAVLVARGSRLAGKGYARFILEMEAKYGVPAAQFLAQATMESQIGGDDGYAQPGFNIGNIRPGTTWDGPTVNGGSGEFRVYGSWEEGIEDYFRLLAGPLYHGKSLKDQIFTYAPPFENDSNHYYDQVVKLIRQWAGVDMDPAIA